MELISDIGVPKTACASFTGYRPEKMRLPLCCNPEEYVRSLVRPFIEQQYRAGVRLFMSGMAEGFDLWAAAEVLALCESGACPQVEIAAVIPYAGQAARYSSRSSELYDYVSRNATHQIILSENYYPECFYRRNDYLVENAGVILAYYDGQSGGTRYTVRMAGKCGIPVINVCECQFTLF